MAKIIEYKSLLERDLAERDAKEVLFRLITIMEDRGHPFYEDGVNRLFPTKNGEPYPLTYTKPA